MSYLVLDVETTIKNKGHPFTPSNKLCLVGTRYFRNSYKAPVERIFKIEYDNEPFGRQLQEIQELIDEHPIVVGFNIKFDLHWLRRYGIRFPDSMRVYDVQLGYFLHTFQEHGYPSLNEVCEAYGLGQKLDVVERDYWSKGIDTTEVPLDVLDPYLRGDLNLTDRAYHAQLEIFKDKPKLTKLHRLQCFDLLVLEEMEYNGILYDVEGSLVKAEQLERDLSGIRSDLDRVLDVPSGVVNWGSPDQLSSVLYGGDIEEQHKQTYLFTYKDPKREPVEKSRWITHTRSFPRLVHPLPRSELKKEGKWQTGGDTLSSLRATGKAKQIIALLLKYADLSKQCDYYAGIPKLIGEMEWSDNVLHGNLNQCVAVTGRLSSNKPNLQNMTEEVHDYIKSRFGSEVPHP